MDIPVPDAIDVDNLINIGSLQQVILQLDYQQRNIHSALVQLSKDVQGCVKRKEYLETMNNLEGQMNSADKRLTTMSSEVADVMHVKDELPKLEADIQRKTLALEKKITAEMTRTSQALTAKSAILENEIKTKATNEDLRKVILDIDGKARKEEVKRLMDNLSTVRDDTNGRIDDLSERAWNRHTDLQEKIKCSTLQSKQIQDRQDERLGILENSQSDFHTFFKKTEKILSQKATIVELDSVKELCMNEVDGVQQQLNKTLQQQKDSVQKNQHDIKLLSHDLQGKANKVDVVPLNSEVVCFKSKLAEFAQQLAAKADLEAVNVEVTKMQKIASDQSSKLEGKAEWSKVTEITQKQAQQVAEAVAELQLKTDSNQQGVTSLTEDLETVHQRVDAKADVKSVKQVIENNDTMKQQVVALKTELEVVLKNLEAWMLEEGGKRNKRSSNTQPTAQERPLQSNRAEGSTGTMPAITYKCLVCDHQNAVEYMPTRMPTKPALPPSSHATGHSQSNLLFTAQTDKVPNGPPFKSESERRKWLLEEKRRWMVQMRLGKMDAYGGLPDIASSQPFLPPIRDDVELHSGMSLDTLATPRNSTVLHDIC